VQSVYIDKTREFVKKLFAEKLPKELSFHDLNHTEEIAEAALEIGTGEGLSNHELEIVVMAALLHDIGYTEQYIGHEEESQFMAEEFLRSIDYPEEKISIIKNCIMATKYRHESGNILEAVVIDADRIAMGKTHFDKRGDLLRKEWSLYLNKEYTDKEWSDIQLQYLNETNFNTNYAIKNYGEQKQINYKHQKELSLKLQQEEMASFTAQSKAYIKKIREYLRTISLSLILGLFIGISLSINVWGIASYAFVIGSISGVIIALFLQFGNDFFEYKILRKYSFPVALVVGTFTLIILFKLSEYVAIGVYNLLFTDLPVNKIFQADVFKDVLRWQTFLNMLWTSFTISIIMNFVKLTSRIIGPKLMYNYILGKYHKPIKEERIFMFLDINSSTSIAEKMSTEKYHEFLNKFFYDVATPISRYGGEIYQYVGDEVVVTWKMKDGLKNSNCIKSYFRIVKVMDRLRDNYIKEYGLAPEFKVGLHGGEVVTGEVGKIKSEIVFHGDVINTTERILNQCITLKRQILISENLLRRIDLLPEIKVEYVTTKTFRGKQNETSLYTLTDIRTRK
jgi:adenylate cyclase